MHVTSLGYRTDLMIRALEGSQIADHAGYVTVRTPANPAFWWGNFLLLPAEAAQAGAEQCLSLFRAEFPAAAHIALGFDVTGEATAGLGSFAAAGVDVLRDTVLTAQGPLEPPHPNHAAVVRELLSVGDWRQSAHLRAVCDAEEEGAPAGWAFTDARDAARRSLAGSGHGRGSARSWTVSWHHSWACSLTGAGSPAIRRWRPIRTPAGRAWPPC